jgi:hypothetical protein
VPDRRANARRKSRPPGILSRRLTDSDLLAAGFRAGAFDTEPFWAAIHACCRAHRERLLDVLLDHHNIPREDPDRWRTLALALSKERFSGFRIGGERGRGRPPDMQRLISRAQRPRRGRGRPADPRRTELLRLIARGVAEVYRALPPGQRNQKRAVERFLDAVPTAPGRRRRRDSSEVARMCRWVSEVKANDPQIAALFMR